MDKCSTLVLAEVLEWIVQVKADPLNQTFNILYI